MDNTENNNIPYRGWWYEVIDFSERDYGSEWGYILYHNGVKVHEVGGIYSSIATAVREAKKTKDHYKKQLASQNNSNS